MPKTYEQLWRKGWENAVAPNFKQSLLHSGFVRRNKKVDAVAKNVTTGFVNFFPLLPPGVGLVIETAVHKAINKTKSVSHAYKNLGEQDLQREVKHNIKELDLEKLDRSRAKVTSAHKDLNKILGEDISFYSPCTHIVKTSTAYNYLNKRIGILKVQAEVMKELSENTLKWCEQIEKSMESKKSDLDYKLKESANNGVHMDCDKRNCIKT